MQPMHLHILSAALEASVHASPQFNAIVGIGPGRLHSVERFCAKSREIREEDVGDDGHVHIDPVNALPFFESGPGDRFTLFFDELEDSAPAVFTHTKVGLDLVGPAFVIHGNPIERRDGLAVFSFDHPFFSGERS